MKKEKLEKIYKANTSEKAAKMLKISIPTLYAYLEDAGIKLKGRGNGKKSKKIKII